MVKAFVLAFYVVPGVLLTLAAWLWLFTVHWAVGLLAGVVLIPTALSFVGHYLDGVVTDRARQAGRQRSGES